MMTKMPRDQWKRIVDSGFVAIVTVLAIFSRLFSARYHNLKKKKTILGLFLCSVDNYSLNPGDLSCQF